MLRSMSHAVRVVAIAALGVPAVAAAQTDTRPVVVVFTFDNNSIGPARGDYDGLKTGVQDLLITDLASNAKIRLVDRSRIADLLQEQNLVRAGQIDPQTAVRLGKILGAQYAITGGFMADKSGGAVMTGRTIDIETSQITSPQKISGKADDVLAMIAQLSSKITSDMNLAPRPARGAGEAGAGDAGGKTGAAQSGSASSGSGSAGAQKGPVSASKPAQAETYAKPLPANVVEKTMKARLDAATMKVYSRALEEMDAKNNAKAADLLRQVKSKFPDFEPAQRNLDKLAAKIGT
jgi:TolB-like protein